MGPFPRVGPNLWVVMLSLFCFWDELMGMMSRYGMNRYDT